MGVIRIEQWDDIDLDAGLGLGPQLERRRDRLPVRVKVAGTFKADLGPMVQAGVSAGEGQRRRRRPTAGQRSGRRAASSRDLVLVGEVGVEFPRQGRAERILAAVREPIDKPKRLAGIEVGLDFQRWPQAGQARRFAAAG
jgi:hypothetical protein